MDYATTIEEAVKRFYATGSNDVHTWILQVQTSPEAWTFVWQLLHPSKSWEVQFYAASTLYTKIARQWREVPENEYSTLRDKILDSMKMPNTSKMVLSKLSQALASFLANTCNIESGQGDHTLIDKVIEILPYNSPQTLDLLLRVLTAIPVEFELLYGNRQTRTRESLIRCWGKTTWLLQQIFQSYERSSPGSNEESLYLLSLECALAWLKLGHLAIDVTAQIYPHFLVAAAKYAGIREDEEMDNRGWEVTQECLMMAVTHEDLTRKRPLLLWEWSKGLVSLARQHGGTVFCGILTSLGEAHSRVFLLALTEDTDETHRWIAETLIELLLECSEHKGRYPVEETRSCIPFGFWFVLQDDLSMLDAPTESRAKNALKPIYARLAQALLRKSTLPSSPSEAGDAEARELHRCYRQDAADTFVYCHTVLGKDLFVLLGQRLSRLESEPLDWTDVESTLHAFNALSAGFAEDEYVAALLDLMVSHIPYGHYPDEVLACACSTVGAYAEWIGEHPDPWLERVLQLVGHGLSVSSITSTPASMALKDISRECGPHLAPLAPSTLEIIERTLRNLPVTSGEGPRLMYAAGKLLNSLPTAEQQMCHLDATLGVTIARVQEILGSSSLPNTSKVEIVSRLKMISTFLSTIEINIGKTILDALLPIFMLIVAHPELSRDDSILEAMHNCGQRSLQSLSNPESDARPLLSILSTSYKTHPHTAALNLLGQVLVLFGRDPENIAASVFAEISAHTLGGFAACRSVGGNLSDLSDILEGYLNLLAQICKKNTKMLFKVNEQIPEMLRCGMACLTVPESGTVKAAGSFINNLMLKMSIMMDGRQKVEMLIDPIGQELVCMILQLIVRISRDHDVYAQVLFTLKIIRSDAFPQWFRFALVDAPGAPIAPEAEKQTLTTKVMSHGRSNKFTFSDALKQFSLKCRPNVGS